IPRRNKVNWHYVRDDHMFTMIKLVSRHQNTQQFGALMLIKLTNKDIRNSNAYKEYYVVAIGATPPKPKASVWKTRSSSDIIVTPPTAAADPRLSTSAKGKQLTTTSKAKSLYALYEEETRDEESFDPISKTPKNTDDEGNGKDYLGTNFGREEGHDEEEEEEEDELYKDVNINLGRGMESIFETTSQMDVQTPTSVAPLPMSAPTLTPSTIATITTTLQAPTPLTTAPSTLLQDLPNFGSLFGFDHQLKTLEANFSEFTQTNQFAGAVSSIHGIVHRYMDHRMNEAVNVAVQLQSDRLRDEAQKENDEFLKTIDENIQKIIKEQVKEQVKRRREGKEPESASGPKEKAIRSAGKSTQGSKSRQNSASESATAEEPMQTTFEIEEPSHPEFEIGKEPESASGPKEKAIRSAGKSTQGSKSRQNSASESATAEEPMQTTFEIEEPSHPEFEIGAYDQPIVEPS
nr:hypothetical protein [Tanacetum cinerariifolium]